MRIQRTNPYQSAAGSLLAALAKGDKSDGVSFQQTFAQNVEAVSSRRRTPDGRDDTAERDLVDRPVRTEPRRRPDRPDRTEPGADDGSARGGTAAAAPVESDTPRDTSPVGQVSAEEPAAAQVEPAAGAEPRDPGPTADAPAETAQAQKPAAQALPSGDKAAASLLDALAAQARTEVLAFKQGSEPKQETQSAPDSQAETLPVVARVVGEAAAEAAVVSEIPDATVPSQAAAAELAKPSALKTARPTAQREDVRQVAAPAVDTSSAGDEPEVPTRQSASQSSFNQAMRNLNFQGQQVKADVVSLTVASSSSVDPASVQSDTSAARLAGPPGVLRLNAGAALQETAESSGADQDEQIERIAHVLRASISRGGSRVTLQLEPAELGRLRVQMSIRGGELFARFETQTDNARQWLEQGMDQLRESLASGGLRLVQATVESRGPQGQTLGGQAGGQNGFAPGSDGGTQQSHGQGTGGSGPDSETDTPVWTEVPAGEDQLDVVA